MLTTWQLTVVSYRNSTSNHNYSRDICLGIGVVSYRNSTSNHNNDFAIVKSTKLYLIEILHQTTTTKQLHYVHRSCILSKFYIKPQLVAMPLLLNMVVSYRNSTSNHNTVPVNHYQNQVVSYRNSTSNHNATPRQLGFDGLYLIEILHQTLSVRYL